MLFKVVMYVTGNVVNNLLMSVVKDTFIVLWVLMSKHLDDPLLGCVNVKQGEVHMVMAAFHRSTYTLVLF